MWVDHRLYPAANGLEPLYQGHLCTLLAKCDRRYRFLVRISDSYFSPLSRFYLFQFKHFVLRIEHPGFGCQCKLAVSFVSILVAAYRVPFLQQLLHPRGLKVHLLLAERVLLDVANKTFNRIINTSYT
jgi:hypothetical protein